MKTLIFLFFCLGILYSSASAQVLSLDVSKITVSRSLDETPISIPQEMTYITKIHLFVDTMVCVSSDDLNESSCFNIIKDREVSNSWKLIYYTEDFNLVEVFIDEKSIYRIVITTNNAIITFRSYNL